jgi:phage shock protein E
MKAGRTGQCNLLFVYANILKTHICMKKFVVIILVLVVLGAIAFLSGSPGEKLIEGVATDNIVLKTVSSSEFAKEIANTDPVILDIRTPAEFSEGHIAEAVNIDYYEADFSTRLKELDKNASYLIYCRTGNRSSKALELMRSYGFTRVYELGGGIVAWSSQGKGICKNC